MKEVEVSIIVATYNPDFLKLKNTIYSIIKQKECKFELIVTDDGSKQNYFIEIKELLQREQFDNYQLVENKKNQGTCKNVYSGLKHASGKYVKVISPGDYLAYEMCLKEWCKYLKLNKLKASFSNTIYYNYEKNQIHVIQRKRTDPIRKNIYSLKTYKKKTVDINCFLLRDYILGAAFMAEKDIMINYCKKLIEAGIVYTEDMMYKLMILDGIKIIYFPKSTVLYEYGIGISTSQNIKWTKLLLRDEENFDKLILTKTTIDIFVKKYQWYLKQKNKSRTYQKFILALLFPTYLLNKVIQKIDILVGKTKSCINIDWNYVNSFVKEK